MLDFKFPTDHQMKPGEGLIWDQFQPLNAEVCSLAHASNIAGLRMRIDIFKQPLQAVGGSG